MFAQNSASQSNIIQLVESMPEIKLNTCEQYKRWEWEHIQRNLYRLSLKSLKLSQIQQSGGTLINQLKNLIITAVVATFVVRNSITLGMMLSIQYIVGMLNSPVEQLINFIRQFQDANLSLNRLQDIYMEKDEDNKNKKNINNNDCDSIIMKHVTFSYDKLSTNSTISDINLCIEKGKTTAIVGLSGSGKSTILKMILGFYQPDKGSITIGTQNLQKINKREWRKKCGTVMQEGYVFADTIAKNIAPNDNNLDFKRIEDAAKIANINDFIHELPLGYNTKIGHDGQGLSIGQKQRLLIARAVYKNPKYIFLDEATNSLDANNEREIMDHLNTFIKGRTAVIIAHRLSTVRYADKIVVIQKGKIMEEGDHKQLIKQKGIYYTLVKNQLNI